MNFLTSLTVSVYRPRFSPKTPLFLLSFEVWNQKFIQHGNTGVFIFPVVWCLSNVKFGEVAFSLASFWFTIIYQLDWQKFTCYGYTKGTSDLTVVRPSTETLDVYFSENV